MVAVPSIIIQKITSGAVVAGALPLVSAVAPNLDTEVTKQLRGRIWRYDTLDSGSGGLFESPVKLAGDLQRALNRANNKGIQGEGDVPSDRVGFSLRRVMFQGTGTTAVQGFLRDPFGVLTVVTSEAVTPVPSFDGSIERFRGVLANGSLLQETLVITTSGGGEVFTDHGHGFMEGSNGGKGFVDYETGNLRLTYGSAPATGSTLAADYKYGSGDVDYEFLDTAKSHSVSADVSLDATNFTWSPPPVGGLIVPPGWQVVFTSAGNLSSVGNIGIVCGMGMGDQVAQDLPGLGAT